MDPYREIREALVQRRAALERRVSRIKGDRQHVAGPLDRDWEEQALEIENDEVLDALDDAGRRELAEIRGALERMERGEYGRCRGCGEPIALGRLRARPTATHCVACAR